MERKEKDDRVRLCHIYEGKKLSFSEPHKKAKYTRDGKRVITIAYKLDRATGKVEYGASIFRRVHTNEVWNRKSHNKSAIGRLTKCPVTLFFETDFLKSATLCELEGKIREKIYNYGVKSRRLNGAEDEVLEINGDSQKEVYEKLEKIVPRRTHSQVSKIEEKDGKWTINIGVLRGCWFSNLLNWDDLSENPNLTEDIIFWAINKPWNWEKLNQNRGFTSGQILRLRKCVMCEHVNERIEKNLKVKS